MKLRKKSFSSKNVFLEKWPFPTGEPVVLHWIKSPMMKGDEKQWMMDVVFKRPNGTLSDLSVPWGLLPMLRLGKEFIDGFATGCNDIGEVSNISFSDKASLKVEESFTAVSKNRYELSTKNNLQEKCVIIFDGAQTVVIPCLEIIRFFFAINKTIAHKLLQPFDFSELVVASIEDKEVFLEFTRQIPQYILSDLFLKFITRTFFDPAWSESLRQIYIEREKQIITTHLKPSNLIPLKCLPPVYKKSIWQVRAIQDGKRIFVLEILKCIDKKPGIFKSIEYTHPGFYSYDKRKHFPAPDDLINYKNKLKVNRTPAGPSGIKNPIIIKNPVPAYIQEEPIEIIKIPYVTKPEGYNSYGIGINVGKTKVDKGKAITISFNDEGKQGNSLAAEFIPTEDNVDVPKGLKDFFKAINAIKNLNPNLDISHTINTTPENSALAHCELGLRKYALVRVKNMGSEVYIIEFDLSDGHSISTILFSPADLKFVERLFDEFIIGQGNWAMEKLEKIISANDIMIDWAKHTSTEPFLWGDRILQKLYKIAG